MSIKFSHDNSFTSHTTRGLKIVIEGDFFNIENINIKFQGTVKYLK